MKQQQNYPGISKMCLFCAVHITGDIKNFVQISILLNKPKELSFYHKLWFSNSNNFATRFPKPLILLAFNSVRSKSLSLKYERFTPSGCKGIGLENATLWQKLSSYVKIGTISGYIEIIKNQTTFWKCQDYFTYKIRFSNKCRKLFQESKTTFNLSCYCHVSWDTLYISIQKDKNTPIKIIPEAIS